MPTEADPLDGYRARTEEDDVNEEIVRGVRGLAESGIDYKSISDVILAQDVRDMLSKDTILAKLVDHCVKTVKENSLIWTQSNEPATLQKEHLHARAANIVLAWVHEISQAGKIAEQLIKQQDTEDNDS